jgi:hypothetical protein
MTPMTSSLKSLRKILTSIDALKTLFDNSPESLSFKNSLTINVWTYSEQPQKSHKDDDTLQYYIDETVSSHSTLGSKIYVTLIEKEILTLAQNLKSFSKDLSQFGLSQKLSSRSVATVRFIFGAGSQRPLFGFRIIPEGIAGWEASHLISALPNFERFKKRLEITHSMADHYNTGPEWSIFICPDPRNPEQMRGNGTLQEVRALKATSAKNALLIHACLNDSWMLDMSESLAQKGISIYQKMEDFSLT